MDTKEAEAAAVLPAAAQAWAAAAPTAASSDAAPMAVSAAADPVALLAASAEEASSRNGKGCDGLTSRSGADRPRRWEVEALYLGAEGLLVGREALTCSDIIQLPLPSSAHQWHHSTGTLPPPPSPLPNTPVQEVESKSHVLDEGVV